MSEKIWTCKIGAKDVRQLPPGSDAPMRKAIEEAFYKLTGKYSDFNFSGWCGRLDKFERNIVNNPGTSLRPTNDLNTRERLYDLVDSVLEDLDEFISLEYVCMKLLLELDEKNENK